MRPAAAAADIPPCLAAGGMACLCAGITRAELAEAIAASAQPTVESLGEALGCGTQCGSCLPLLKEALGEQAWFGATATARPLTRARDLQGIGRLIYRVDLAIDGERPYPKVQPGQHVVLRANVDGALVERTYTVVAQDIERQRLTVAIRRKPEGALTPWLLGEEGADRLIEVSAPGGPGLGTGGYRSVVFFAGGVGVTPAVAMVNALGASATLHLDYSVADRDDAAFLPKFARYVIWPGVARPSCPSSRRARESGRASRMSCARPRPPVPSASATCAGWCSRIRPPSSTSAGPKVSSRRCGGPCASAGWMAAACTWSSSR